MEIQTIKISEEERVIISSFMGEEYPSDIDFNRLMPVVEKIWGITNCSESIFYFTIGYKRYIMPEKNTGKHIEVCWDACIAFIKWYNQNKPSAE